MPLPTGQNIDMRAEYRKHYDSIGNDRAKALYLCMLKERFYIQGDKEAGAVFPELAALWVNTPFQE